MGNRKRIEEILKMSKEELYQYLRKEDSSLQLTDRIEMEPFDNGLKIFYFRQGADKPHKTRVFLHPGESESLE